MNYLLDTNVVSELMRPRPEKSVIEWLNGVPSLALHLSVITLGEIRHGVERLEEGRRKDKLRVWLEQDLPAWYETRILPISAAVADRWGRLRKEIGRHVPAVDSLLAATALHHDLCFVTRNEADFQFPGLTVANPWRE